MRKIKDYCLFWGLPGIAILAVSLFVAVRVSQDFAQDGLVKCVTFIGCNILLWLLYIILQSVLQDILLSPSLSSRRTIINNVSEKVGEEESAAVMQEVSMETIETERLVDNVTPIVFSIEEKPISVAEESQQEPTDSSIPTSVPSTDTFIIQKMRILELEKKRMERKAAVQKAVAEYVPYALAPYVRKEDMDGVVSDVVKWTDDENHEPQPVSVTEKNSATSIDLRHFIWNINVRLIERHSGESCVRFLLALFPSIFSEMSPDSIRNFTAKASGGGLIPIDRPDGLDFAFHHESAPEEPSETDNNEEND